MDKPPWYGNLVISAEQMGGVLERANVHQVVQLMRKSRDYLKSAIGRPMPPNRLLSPIEQKEISNYLEQFR